MELLEVKIKLSEMKKKALDGINCNSYLEKEKLTYLEEGLQQYKLFDV